MSATETTVDSLVNQPPSLLDKSSFINAIWPWVVCLSASLFFFYEFIQMNKFNTIHNGLLHSFSLNPVQLGYLSSTYLTGDVMMLIFSGLIIDRFSTRTIIITAMLISSFSTLGFALTNSVYVAGLFHLLEGASSAFCLISNVILASRWFPPRRQALVIGVMIAIAMSGGLVAQTPLELLSAAYGWRHALILDSFLGFMILGLIWAVVQDSPNGLCVRQQRIDDNAPNVWESIKLAMNNRQNWLCGIYTSLLNLPIMVLGAVWGNMYLTQVQGISNHDATTITSMLFFGTIVGSPISGWISDLIGRRKLPMIIGVILSMATLLFIMYSPDLSYRSLITLFFALGLLTSTQVITYPTVKESNNRLIGATALSVASVLIMGGAAISQPLYAKIFTLGGHGVMRNNITVYQAHDFLNAMWLMAGAFIACLIVSFFIRETYCKAQK